MARLLSLSLALAAAISTHGLRIAKTDATGKSSTGKFYHASDNSFQMEQGSRTINSHEELASIMKAIKGSQVPKDAPKDEVHSVFTTDCNKFMDWQSDLLFFSALKVGHKGPITRILCGCTPEQEKHVSERTQKLFPDRFSVVAAPAYKFASRSMSKPLGVAYWLANVQAQREVVAVLDPDFVFLRPLTTEIPAGNSDRYGKDAPTKVEGDVVASGLYGIFGQGPGKLMLHGERGEEIDPAQVVGKESPAAQLTNQDSYNYYSVGCPYIATRQTMAKLVPSWGEFALKLHEAGDTSIYVDMYAWVLASAHHKLPNVANQGYMVSNPESSPSKNLDGEDWSFLAGLQEKDNMCIEPDKLDANAKSKLPVFLHYCQGYKGPGNKQFGKYDWRQPPQCGDKHTENMLALGEVEAWKNDAPSSFAYCHLQRSLKEVTDFTCSAL